MFKGASTTRVVAAARMAAFRTQTVRHASSGAVRAQSAVFTETGEPSKVLRVVDHEIGPADALTGTQALIRMLAAPVNPSDLNQIEGVYPVKPRFASGLVQGQLAAVGGNEGVGEVLASGPESGLCAGDWVVPRSSGVFGTWATHAVVASDDAVVRIPHDWLRGGNVAVQALDVATVKVNPSTAYRMLRDFCQLRPGDCVVQNGANSGVGRAVIQLAREMGVRTINVVRRRDDFDSLAAELEQLGADAVVMDSELADSAVRDRILRRLDSPAVRLGFNCVGGRPTLLMTRLLSQGATLVSYGAMARQPLTLPTSLLLFGDLRARGFWMNRWYADNIDSSERSTMWEHILRLTAASKFVAQPMVKVEWPASAPMLPAEIAETRVREAVAWSSGGKHAFVFSS
ncbi:mitochondrial 2-enoyl thioester reductase [Coemansia sp. RSA 1285]|nr:mitochondrial 2-enoyl thioester reductase [Coemansia sp. RSA 1804]KAJ2693788.1 mitochondrial 2-enoyl thioester reductase [Coemansia sp. RSA 1285]